jgi:hypothetical protein
MEKPAQAKLERTLESSTAVELSVPMFPGIQSSLSGQVCLRVTQLMAPSL